MNKSRIIHMHLNRCQINIVGTATTLVAISTKIAWNSDGHCHHHAGCTKKDPIVVGKPAEFMLANIAEAFGMERHQICMVGDRLDTDILFGQDGGLSTMLVLSGAYIHSDTPYSPFLQSIPWTILGVYCYICLLLACICSNMVLLCTRASREKTESQGRRHQVA